MQFVQDALGTAPGEDLLSSPKAREYKKHIATIINACEEN
jgi:hypothetical protein